MNQENTERLKEIVKLAVALDWVDKSCVPSKSYPTMQLSEVEKCMIAMVDDFELKRMRKWVQKKAVAVLKTQ